MACSLRHTESKDLRLLFVRLRISFPRPQESSGHGFRLLIGQAEGLRLHGLSPWALADNYATPAHNRSMTNNHIRRLFSSLFPILYPVSSPLILVTPTPPTSLRPIIGPIIAL